MSKKGTIICGVDEAGRGAVLGPLVLAGVSINEKDLPKLKKLGVRDSKELTPEQRERLSERIEKVAKDVIVLKVGPCKIDSYSRQGVNLNRVEAMKMCAIIDFLSVNKAYVDGPELNLGKFKRILAKMLKNETDLVVEHKADVNYPVVSAASIIAKVERDNEMGELRKKYGVDGTGYPSDERTINWMKAYLKENKKFPTEGLVRHTWITTKDMLGDHRQIRLGNFFKKLVGK
ncbi:MAG: ribonuclease HII [Candidatus Aenigmatarchaeota archaeon]|nr:MAG: ribonuclease HII [Candidatus Aenigmarchaeota archaeon]